MDFESFSHIQSSLSLDSLSDEVHLWCASLEQDPQNLRVLHALLAPDELARAGRYYFEKHRNYFIARRGLLRMVLSAYLGIAPTQLQFSYGPFGKPSLKTESYNRVIQFNLSHSNGMAAYVVSKDRRVGVDVEYLRTIPEATYIAEQFFSPYERNLIHSLPIEERSDAFIKIWACKEAFLKATGEGLTKPLKEIEILLNQGPEGQLSLNHGEQLEASSWRLETIRNIPGYIAVVVAEGPDWKINTKNILKSTSR